MCGWVWVKKKKSEKYLRKYFKGISGWKNDDTVDIVMYRNDIQKIWNDQEYKNWIVYSKIV